MNNARFTIYKSGTDMEYSDADLPLSGGGDVTLTLAAGESLSWHQFGYTDEGYSSTRELYEYDGAIVIRTTETRSRDCDGPHESYYQSAAAIDSRDDNGRLLWRVVDSRQRDVFAELMNY